MQRKGIFVVLLLQLLVGAFSQNCNANQNSRTDCGYDGITQQQCESKGCCWQPVQEKGFDGIPWCFYTTPFIEGYKATNVQTSPTGLEADLILVQGSDMYGTDITPLHLSVTFETTYRLHVKINDPNNARWEVPYVVKAPASTASSNLDFEFSYTIYPFGFAVTRVSTNEVLFNTTMTSTSFNGLIFEDQYIEISTQLPSNDDKNIYGIGEHVLPIRLSMNDTLTLWNADHPAPVHMNVYGSHPFYMDLRSKYGNTHGVFLLNSNGMDVVLQENSLTYKIIGGVLDFYFFMGPTPDQVVSQYTELIGKPYHIPYWVLGFHQCRWGYHNISEVETVVTKYAAADIPLEAMWTDIDYMDAYMDFTFDPIRFPPAEMAAWVNTLHENNQHYVLITDPGIHNLTGYPPYDIGNQMDVWVKDANGNPFIGKVWPGTTVFPDFTNSQSFEYWYTQIQNFYSEVPFDGLWIDMNEISNFCSGECGTENTKKSLEFDPNNPPYTINNGDNHNPLDYDTLAMDAIHNISIEYNVHNLFGMLEAAATKQALEKVRNSRAFVLSRSTFPSSGHHTAHWTGDVSSTWEAMYYTIPDMLNFNIYGIPLVGSDICGFNGDTTEELCARWIELGAFYPFSRNHNAINQLSQELYQWPEVANISRKVLNARYSIVPYYYTLFYQAHVGLGGTVARPLFFEFPTDSNTYAIDRQFLIGSGLMISPVLEQGATTVNAYFPAGLWYDFWTGDLTIDSTGQTLTLQAPIDVIQVHVLGGTIIPMQTPSYTLTQSRLNPFGLLVALDENSQASGFLYLDDGDSLKSVINKKYTSIQYQVQSGKLVASVTNTGFYPTAAMGSVTVLGVTTAPTEVSVNGNGVTTFTYSGETLAITGLTLSVTQNFAIVWN